MSDRGQRIRTPKEREAALRMMTSGQYFADQQLCERELQKIHESECSECQPKGGDIESRIQAEADKYAEGSNPVESRLMKLAFEAGARMGYGMGVEDAAKVCDEIQLRGLADCVAQPGAMSAAITIRALKGTQ